MENQNSSSSQPDLPIQEVESQNKEGIKNKMSIVVIIIVFIALILSSIFLWQSKFIDQKVERVTVIVSAPFNQSAGSDIVNGATLAFEKAGYKAGDVTVDIIVLNDGDEDGTWQEDLERKNAEIAVSDEDVVAYIGPLNSGAAKVSMPILNKAGIVQVSPGNTWPGLTKEGFFPGEPAKFYPTGIRHYTRVVTTDDFQGPAAAIWAQDLGFDSIYIVDDGDVYGKGVADLFQARAEDLGMTVLKHITLNGSNIDFKQKVLDIKEYSPDLVYYGGNMMNGAEFLSQMRDVGIESNFMAPDAILQSDFISNTGEEYAEGVFATTVGVSSLEIETPKVADYHSAYVERFNKEPGTFSLFAYEAANVVIRGIERAEIKNREEIREEIKNTKNFDGALGIWSFDELGDTTLRLISGHVVHNGKFEFIKTLQTP